MQKRSKNRPSTGHKGTKKSGLSQVIGQIKSRVKEKCHLWHISLDGMTSNESLVTLTAHTAGASAKCPCCGRRSTSVHSHRLRKLQCTELLGSRTLLILDVRHFVCSNPKCAHTIFSEPLAMTRPYGRHTYEAEGRIRHEALGQTARKACKTLAMQHIQISQSSLIRTLRLMGSVNPEVRTSGYVGMDDFAKWKGHKYMCVIVDHYTRLPLAVFDSRYGQEITDWLKAHPEIKVVTRDGSQSYASIISAAGEFIMQVSDRFHLMQALKRDAVEPIRQLLGQKKARMQYPYPTEDEAYKAIVGDICQMGEKRHREKVLLYYEVSRLKDEGKSIAETARIMGVKSQKVHKALNTDIRKLLSQEQKQAMAAAREIARIVSSGCISPPNVLGRLDGKLPSRLLSRCMRSIVSKYRPLRKEVRLHNKALGEQKKAVKVKGSTIWNYIVTGETESKKLLKLKDTHPEVEQIIQVCIRFRKMLHGEDDAPTMDEWIKEAAACHVKEIRDFAEYIRKDRKAVELACSTCFNNGLLEGTVNKTKAIKRSMFNRANADVLRAKLLYGNLKWDWNYHLN